MARKALIENNEHRARLIKRYAAKRAELKAILKDSTTSDENFYKAQRQLTELPRNSSPTRIRNRCNISGRPRSYSRRFGLSRICLRELGLSGKLPGVRMSSW